MKMRRRVAFLSAHLGSCGVCFETVSLSPSEEVLASSTLAASSDLSPAWDLPLILLHTGEQRHFSHGEIKKITTIMKNKCVVRWKKLTITNFVVNGGCGWDSSVGGRDWAGDWTGGDTASRMKRHRRTLWECQSQQYEFFSQLTASYFFKKKGKGKSSPTSLVCV